MLLEKTHDLLASQQLDAGHCLSVPNGHSDLRGRKSLLGHGDDEVADGTRGVCDPASSSALEWRDSRADTLALALRLDSAHNHNNINLRFNPNYYTQQVSLILFFCF